VILLDEREVLNFANKLASRWPTPGLSKQEKSDAVVFGVCRALKSYNPNCAQFSTWLYVTVFWELARNVRKAARDRHRRAGCVYCGSLEELSLADPCDVEDRIVFRVDLERTLKKVASPEEEEIFFNFFEGGMTIREIASSLHKSESEVKNTIQSLRRKLAKKLDPW